MARVDGVGADTSSFGLFSDGADTQFSSFGGLAGFCRDTPGTPRPSQVLISYANTYNVYTWFQSKLLHVYFNITNEKCSV